MKPNELVGRRIKLARVEANEDLQETARQFGLERPNRIDQASFGRMLEPYLGRIWSKRQVSAAETGHKVLDPGELFALAAVTGRPIGWFFTPLDESGIEMPGRDLMSSLAMRLATGSYPPGTETKIIGPSEAQVRVQTIGPPVAQVRVQALREAERAIRVALEQIDEEGDER